MGQLVSSIFGGGKSGVDQSVLDAQKRQDEAITKREKEEADRKAALLRVSEGLQGGGRRFTLFSRTGERGVQQPSDTLGAT